MSVAALEADVFSRLLRAQSAESDGLAGLNGQRKITQADWEFSIRVRAGGNQQTVVPTAIASCGARLSPRIQFHSSVLSEPIILTHNRLDP
jgi:hypothetical protein